jgi:hypothetical protein
MAQGWFDQSRLLVVWIKEGFIMSIRSLLSVSQVLFLNRWCIFRVGGWLLSVSQVQFFNRWCILRVGGWQVIAVNYHVIFIQSIVNCRVSFLIQSTVFLMYCAFSQVCNKMATKIKYALDYHDLCVKVWIKHLADNQIDSSLYKPSIKLSVLVK